MYTPLARSDWEPLLLRFIIVEPAVHGTPPHTQNFNLPKAWGWCIDDDGDYMPGFVPPMGFSFCGVKKSADEAQDAALAYIRKNRRDLVREAMLEAGRGRAYRAHKQSHERP